MAELFRLGNYGNLPRYDGSQQIKTVRCLSIFLIMSIDLDGFGLREKSTGNPYIPRKNMVSCRFSLQPNPVISANVLISESEVRYFLESCKATRIMYTLILWDCEDRGRHHQLQIQQKPSGRIYFSGSTADFLCGLTTLQWTFF